MLPPLSSVSAPWLSLLALQPPDHSLHAAVTSITSSQFVFKYCAVPLLLLRENPVDPEQISPLEDRNRSPSANTHRPCWGEGETTPNVNRGPKPLVMQHQGPAQGCRCSFCKNTASPLGANNPRGVLSIRLSRKRKERRDCPDQKQEALQGQG